jgi:hypothetical protein
MIIPSLLTITPLPEDPFRVEKSETVAGIAVATTVRTLSCNTFTPASVVTASSACPTPAPRQAAPRIPANIRRALVTVIEGKYASA